MEFNWRFVMNKARRGEIFVAIRKIQMLMNHLQDYSNYEIIEKINQKYKHYLSIKGIPEDEVDEFVSLHSAYKKIGGNHHGDAKFNYCMEHLPIIPVEVKLKYDE